MVNGVLPLLSCLILSCLVLSLWRVVSFHGGSFLFVEGLFFSWRAISLYTSGKVLASKSLLYISKVRCSLLGRFFSYLW